MGGALSGKLKAGPSRGQPPRVAVPLRSKAPDRLDFAAKANARLPVSRTRRRRALRTMLIGSVVAHLIFLALLILAPRPNEETPPAELGVAMEFEQPKPQGAPSDQPRPLAHEGTKAPVTSPQQSSPPAQLAGSATQPTTQMPPPTPPSVVVPESTALQPPPETSAPDTPSEAPATPDSVPVPDTPPPVAPITPSVSSSTLPTPAGQRSAAPTPDTAVVVPAPLAEQPSDVQVSPGPLAELFNFGPPPMPRVAAVPPPPRTPLRPKPSRSSSAFPTPRQWGFGPGTPLGGSVAQGSASRGLNLSFAPQIHGGGGPKSSPDFSAPDAGPDWENELHAWWDRHGYFPREAAEAGEQGTVGLHLIVGHDGHVTSARLTTASGSVFLDQGALGLFREANLPPLPPQTDKPQIPVDLRIHYVLR